MFERRDAHAVEVALDLPLYETFHYLVPEPLLERAVIGVRLLVPLGNRKITGYLLGYSEPPEGIELREVLDILDEHPLFRGDMAELLPFTARYLFYPIGEVIRGALPAGINVESEEWISRTTTGHFAWLSRTIRGPKEELLSVFEEDEEIGIKDLLKRVERGRTYHVRELVRDGFLQSRTKLTKPRVRVRRERFYLIVEGVSLARREVLLKRSKKQRAVYEWLETRKEASITEIKGALGKVAAELRALLKKGLIDLEEREILEDPFFSEVTERIEAPPLTPAQQETFDTLLPGIHNRQFQPCLLHGVTGSGKTELYIRLIDETLKQDRQAILLVPEISLTPQLVHYFRTRLGDQLTVLHSGLDERERFAQWTRLRQGELPVVIGARSAVFAPFEDLGLIIVDEEHESSYKQEGRFPYHARNLAMMRGKLADATVVLGSATPALESYYYAQVGKWQYLELPERVNKRPMPPIEVVDLRAEEMGDGGILSLPLEAAMEETLAAGNQTVLFLNRRGYNASVLCSSCGTTQTCIHCSVSLTYHQSQGLLVCHYCGFSRPMPDDCPKCHNEDLTRLGLGTEQVEEVVRRRFPDARVARMDRDTISKMAALEDLVARFRRKEIDILVGTQMIAKGHDFPGVTLVGVLLADMGLTVPDFRSAERSFQLLTQVAGRAGRSDLEGRVLVQTYQPEHPAVVFAQTHDYKAFYDAEIEKRYEGGYPPFAFLVCLRFEGKDPGRVKSIAQQFGKIVHRMVKSERFQDVGYIGPAPAPIQKIKNKFRWQLILRSPSRAKLHQLSWQLVEQELSTHRQKQVKITIDADPVSML